MEEECRYLTSMLSHRGSQKSLCCCVKRASTFGANMSEWMKVGSVSFRLLATRSASSGLHGTTTKPRQQKQAWGIYRGAFVSSRAHADVLKIWPGVCGDATRWESSITANPNLLEAHRRSHLSGSKCSRNRERVANSHKHSCSNEG